MTAYRHNVEPRAIDAGGNRDVLPVAVVLWLASVALCLLRLRSGEPLEVDGSLAAIIAFALPLALLRIKKV